MTRLDQSVSELTRSPNDIQRIETYGFELIADILYRQQLSPWWIRVLRIPATRSMAKNRAKAASNSTAVKNRLRVFRIRSVIVQSPSDGTKERTSTWLPGSKLAG